MLIRSPCLCAPGIKWTHVLACRTALALWHPPWHATNHTLQLICLFHVIEHDF